METKRWTMHKDEIDNNVIDEAADLLRNGQTVAIPTETVYGLGADATNEAAVSRIFQAKGRPEDNPLIAHVAGKQQLRYLVDKLPPVAEKLVDAFTPGPLTLVLPETVRVPVMSQLVYPQSGCASLVTRLRRRS